MKSIGHRRWRSVRPVVTAGVIVSGLLVTPWALARSQSEKTMDIFYLEIVTKEVDAVCATYAATFGVEFSKPDAGLGNARTAKMPNGGMVGVRAPMRDTEDPIVRPYWLVDDIKSAVAAAEKAGGTVAHPPLEIPGHGTFAIYIQGGINHGLWQR